MNVHNPPPGYQLAQIPPEVLPQAWPALTPYLDSVFERSGGRLNEQSLMQLVDTERMQIWAIVDGSNDNAVSGVVGTDLTVAETGVKVANIRFCVGDEAAKWLHLLDNIEEWARQNGATRIAAIARKGWQRKLPDYKFTHVLLEKDL